jgi:hypothetical protein
MKKQDLAALRDFVQQSVATDPLARELTIDRSYQFTLFRYGRAVDISLYRGNKVYVYHGGTGAARDVDKPSSATRVFIVQPGFQLLVRFSSRIVRWLPADSRAEAKALVRTPRVGAEAQAS